MDDDVLPFSSAVYLIDGCNVIGKRFPTDDDYVDFIGDLDIWASWKIRKTGKQPHTVVFFDSGAKSVDLDLSWRFDVKVQEDENCNADCLLLEYLAKVRAENSTSNIYVVTNDEKDIISKVKNMKNVEPVSVEDFKRRISRAMQATSDLYVDEISRIALGKCTLEEKNEIIANRIPAGTEYVLTRNGHHFYCEVVDTEIKLSIEDFFGDISAQGNFLIVIMDVTNSDDCNNFISKSRSFYVTDIAGKRYEPVDYSIESAAAREYKLGNLSVFVSPGETISVVIVFDIPPDQVNYISGGFLMKILILTVVFILLVSCTPLGSTPQSVMVTNPPLATPSTRTTATVTAGPTDTPTVDVTATQEAVETAAAAPEATARYLFESCRKPLEPTFAAAGEGMMAGDPTQIVIWKLVDKAIEDCLYVYQTAMAPTLTPTP